MLQGHVLQSQTLLQITMIIYSCFAVSLFLFQCTRWGIPFKSYLRLYAISIQGLMQRTKPSKVRMMQSYESCKLAYIFFLIVFCVICVIYYCWPYSTAIKSLTLQKRSEKILLDQREILPTRDNNHSKSICMP